MVQLTVFPETGFDITAASEVMAILCLSNSIDDLKEARQYFYWIYFDKPVYQGFKANEQWPPCSRMQSPNLVQTLRELAIILEVLLQT